MLFCNYVVQIVHNVSSKISPPKKKKLPARLFCLIQYCCPIYLQGEWYKQWHPHVKLTKSVLHCCANFLPNLGKTKFVSHLNLKFLSPKQCCEECLVCRFIKLQQTVLVQHMKKKHLSHKYQVKDEWIVCSFDHFVF